MRRSLAAGPALAAVADRVDRLGDRPGIAATVKMTDQLLAGAQIAAACEAMALGVRAGADAATPYEVIANSAGNSQMFTNRVPHILARDFIPLPVAAATQQQFLAAAAASLGGEDDSAVVKARERLAGIEVGG
jgi:putative dehydrogenase